jgi:hypothetical protein
VTGGGEQEAAEARLDLFQGQQARAVFVEDLEGAMQLRKGHTGTNKEDLTPAALTAES